MPTYDYRCPDGHRFERLVPITDRDAQRCPACGAGGTRLPAAAAIGGVADAGPSREQMPQTWKGTGGANREYVGHLRRQWDGRQKLEEKYPELAGDRRPVVAHEGRYHDAPLRAGDTPLGAPTPTSED
ncbi:FmdB family zinc ribbon protein [Nocardioides pantholopis]|uniref:FmdB family zinc ribbon protein n=1 Tax=Nocardioides pantholopis TaxID=2483798 RepID=UPI000F0999AE|nr:FmdB family zinc ribbon protein [Nocardioides pantholopis]